MIDKADKALLVVEDNPGDARLLLEMFNEQSSGNTDVTQVTCMIEAEQHLVAHAVDIVVLDLGLPDAQGLEAVRRVHTIAPRVPLVVLTGLDDESVAVQALQEGAQDYLVKGQIEAPALLRALRYAIERKTMEEALLADAEQLRKSRQHLAHAQILAEIGSFERDLDSGQVIWSDNLYTIFGIDRETFPISRVGELVDPADRDRFVESFSDDVVGAVTMGAEYRIIRPDSGRRKIIVDTAPSAGWNSRRGILLGTVRDVTSAKAADDRLRLLETQLHHSQKLEALGTLAGGIAHELNNALAPTIMMTDLVMETHPEGSPERTQLALALAGARRAKELVRRILSFVRKEATEKHELDLATRVNEAMAMLRASLPATIEMSTRVEPIPALFGDSGQLYQVIVNLVTNAAHAIGDKPGQISVTLRLGSSGTRIELLVADTGIGMDETTKQRIFDPFFTTKAVNEGTGLGLSIVHGIVVAHGGTITVTSQLGRGSQFCISLPVAGERDEDGAGIIPTAA
jgi:signal transduction histidine kinase